MIPQAYITEWSNNVPWQTNEQVEQDLVICRSLVEIFKDEFLANSLTLKWNCTSQIISATTDKIFGRY